MKKLSLILSILVFLHPVIANATFSNFFTDELEVSGVTSSSDSFSPTIPDLGSNSVCVVSVGVHVGALNVSGVTYAGTGMTEIAGGTVTDGTRDIKSFYILNPSDNGSKTIVTTYSASAIHTSHVAIVCADGSSTISLDDTSTGSGTTQNPTITSTQAVANELVMSYAVSSANAIGSPSVSNCTETEIYDSGGNTSSGCYSLPSLSGDTTHTYNFSESGSYVISSFSFTDGDSGGGGTSTPSSTCDTATVAMLEIQSIIDLGFYSLALFFLVLIFGIYAFNSFFRK